MRVEIPDPVWETEWVPVKDGTKCDLYFMQNLVFSKTYPFGENDIWSYTDAEYAFREECAKHFAKLFSEKESGD